MSGKTFELYVLESPDKSVRIVVRATGPADARAVVAEWDAKPEGVDAGSLKASRLNDDGPRGMVAYGWPV